MTVTRHRARMAGEPDRLDLRRVIAAAKLREDALISRIETLEAARDQARDAIIDLRQRVTDLEGGGS